MNDDRNNIPDSSSQNNDSIKEQSSPLDELEALEQKETQTKAALTPAEREQHRRRQWQRTQEALLARRREEINAHEFIITLPKKKHSIRWLQRLFVAALYSLCALLAIHINIANMVYYSGILIMPAVKIYHYFKSSTDHIGTMLVSGISVIFHNALYHELFGLYFWILSYYFIVFAVLLLLSGALKKQRYKFITGYIIVIFVIHLLLYINLFL